MTPIKAAIFSELMSNLNNADTAAAVWAAPQNSPNGYYNHGKSRMNSDAMKKKPADCTVIIGGSYFSCNLEVLQLHCDYFDHGRPGMAFGLPECKVSGEAFFTAYSWMMQPSTIVRPDQIVPLYFVAKYLRIDELLKQYRTIFKSASVMREEIGFHVFLGHRKWNVVLSHHVSLKNVQKYYLTLIGRPEFYELYGSDIIALLSSNSICVNSELEVLLSAIIWLLHHWKNHHEWLDSILKCVHFNLIPREALCHFVQHPSGKELNHITAHPLFLNHLADTHTNSNYNIHYGSQRSWIYDPHSSYHHDSHCVHRNYFTFEQFSIYQTELRTVSKLHWYSRQMLNPYKRSCRNLGCQREMFTKHKQRTYDKRYQ
ncbi:uncharacterized protein LOC115627407 [Scaptodrosophila lebanonensis]|uniref:Uncharacterized protein LOC115627407 n=1 Tax=Drosophila lebanonensis TaxID=7225 RepID=A0A6J2TVJ1_DROLE|nr:uncharacterized protein LOC115627407 [Scaptodrosophila lebanonensis]